ncbi:MAG TPA: 2Fe-2S iron-sulfur cluster-binding protein [Streptosporangiaceae bacterium]|jgi:ferredoxin|nr:2Fe-2S iron-sulfur cluster-binding protein [Streptosporangiaceae bacterium]
MLHALAAAGSGREIWWLYGARSRADSYASLLELAEACDVPVRWSCRTGVCHTCETSLMSGAVRYAPEPVDEPAGGSALICCSQPREDLVVDL